MNPPLTPLPGSSPVNLGAGAEPAEDTLEISLNKSLPEEVELSEDEIDTVKLTETTSRWGGWSTALGLTLIVLTTPLTVTGFVVGGTVGFGLGLIKNIFIWDEEYGKEFKTQPHFIPIMYALPPDFIPGVAAQIPIGKLKSISSNTIDMATSLASWLSIQAFYKVSEEYQKKQAEKVEKLKKLNKLDEP
jgi:hypothetical protein